MTTLIIDGTPSAVVPAVPTREMWAKAGTAVVETRMRSGNHDDMSAAVHAALWAAAPPDLTGAVIELRAALEAMCDDERTVANNSFGGGGQRPCTDGEWADSDPSGFARYRRARAALERVKVTEDGCPVSLSDYRAEATEGSSDAPQHARPPAPPSPRHIEGDEGAR